MTNKVDTQPLFIGVDGGGTKCRAIVYSESNGVLGTGLGGPANPLHGLERTFESILLSTQMALRDAGLPLETVHRLVAGVGLAGVNVPSLYDKVTAWAHPFKELYLTTDLHTACIGAHEGQDGAVIITGTGSCGFSSVKGRHLNLGGHGFNIGDIGSGAWLGLEATKAVLLALDGLGPETLLCDKFVTYFNTTSAMGIAGELAGQPSSGFARLARLVIETAGQGDKVALEIVKEGAAYISRLADKLLQTEPPRLSMIGGLAEPLQQWLDPAVAARVAPPKQPPEIGAVYFARQSVA